MYAYPAPANDRQLGAVPAWLAAIGNKIIRGTMVTIPGPAGPIVFDLGDPNGTARAQAAINAAKAAISGARVTTTVSNRPPTALEKLNQDVTQGVPGGWAGVAVGAGLLFVLVGAMRR